MAIKHGMHGTATYRSWNGMKQRCDNINNKRYSDYGGRGISYDLRWGEFENFLLDMGVRPDGMSLDRIENDGNYEKDNCKWSTAIEQMNNRRNNRILIYKGESKTLTQWAKKIGVKPTVLDARLRRRWALERAITESTIYEKELTFKGKTKTISEWCDYLGMNRNALYTRLHRGWSVEKTLSTPTQKNIIITVNGETKTAGEWRTLLNIPKSTFHNRLKRGWTEEEALFGKNAGGCG